MSYYLVEIVGKWLVAGFEQGRLRPVTKLLDKESAKVAYDSLVRDDLDLPDQVKDWLEDSR